MAGGAPERRCDDGVTITIPKEILEQAGLTEQEALVEFDCRLFQSKRLTLGSAVRLAAITRMQFEEELKTGGYLPTS
jgi:predicted HTH domain antitoxin